VAQGGLEVERRLVIEAPADRVLAAFIDANDLAKWWQVSRSFAVPRPLGLYALEWRTTEYRDPVLGRLGGSFHGTIMEYRPGVELFVADAIWTPPEGEPIGPMALEVRCTPQRPEVTGLAIRQSAEDEGPRWQRYFEVIAAGWDRALEDLKQYLESAAMRARLWR
jgi:uncharacterized protein YndB with AHSA1/START domain